MKKLIVLTLLMVMFTANTVYASQTLRVEKLTQNSDIKTGDNVTILLRFFNPFNKQIPIKIVDKDIFGNNGINVQCFEYTLSSKNETVLAYTPIRPFKAGKFVLDPAEVTYTNPDTGKEETIKSNTLEINVKDSGTQQNSAQGITTIYKCNGVNMQSTSYSSSGSSINIQMGTSNFQQQPNQNTQQSASPSEKVQNNQMNQNSKALKQEMEKQLQEQKKMKREFEKLVTKSPTFQKQHRKLLSSGYNFSNASFSPVTNSTGTFKLSYKNKNGQTATMKGEMVNGTIKKLMTLTAEDKQKILDMLRQNKDFRAYSSELKSQGFNEAQATFDQISQNHTKVTIPYRKGEIEKNITAEYINGTITHVKIKKNDKEETTSWWWIIILLSILAVASWFIYMRYIRKIQSTERKLIEVKTERPINYKKEAHKMLEAAKKLFEKGKEKDAYEKVSQGVRFYFSYKLELRKDITSAELLQVMRRKNIDGYDKVRKCLNMCALVEFAKYNPNKKDFGEILRIAEELISS